jgi:alkylhydroperoxidase family enzyme
MPIIEPQLLDGAKGSTDRTIESFRRLSGGDTIFPQILAHVPAYAEAIWGAMAEALFEGGVDHRLKELMRIQLAASANDPYFSTMRSAEAVQAGLAEEDVASSLGDFQTNPRFTDAEKWALRFSYLMYRHPDQVDADFYSEGKRHYSEAQIMEMGGLIAIHYGLAVFMGTLNVD